MNQLQINLFTTQLLLNKYTFYVACNSQFQRTLLPKSMPENGPCSTKSQGSLTPLRPPTHKLPSQQVKPSNKELITQELSVVTRYCPLGAAATRTSVKLTGKLSRCQQSIYLMAFLTVPSEIGGRIVATTADFSGQMILSSATST